MTSTAWPYERSCLSDSECQFGKQCSGPRPSRHFCSLKCLTPSWTFSVSVHRLQSYILSLLTSQTCKFDVQAINRHQNEVNRVLTLIDTVVALEASRVKFPLPKQKSHFEVGPALLDPFEVSLRQATPVRVSSLRPGSGESLDLFRLSLSQQTSTGHPKLP